MRRSRLSALLLLFAPVLMAEKCFEGPTQPPEVVPDAPTIGNVVAGEGTAEVNFVAAQNTGTQPLTGFTATCTGGAATSSATATISPIIVTGLTNGVQYACSVTAESAAGASVASASVSVVPFTIPGAPTVGSVTPVSGGAVVNFVAPASNGGSGITGYTATCTPAAGGAALNNTGTASPITVSNLTNGTQYSCTVFATNARGTGSPSSSANVTPATTPGAPTITDVVAGNGQTTISFDAGATGGSAITTFSVTCTATGQTTRAANNPTSPITVTQLVNGVQYTCDVRAANAIGVSPASASQNVTPVGPPGAPTNAVATPGNASASVAFGVPSSTGGSAITGYTATCVTTTPGGAPAQSTSGSASPLTVNSLVNGMSWTCTVVATNVHGNSAASTGATVTPRTVPGAPTGLIATAGNTSASIAFTAPVSNGGATVTGYTVTCTAGGQPNRTGTGTTSPISVTQLVNFVQYACTVVATNAAGNGTASTAANVTPTNLGLGTSTLCGYSWNQVNNAITNTGGTVYTSIVSYTCNTTQRTMTMNQVPDHPGAAQAASGNPNKMIAQSNPSSVAFTLNPAVVGMTPKGNVVGWAINGVKFDPATAEICPTQSYCSTGGATYGAGTTWNVEALGQTLFSAGVDGANAHIQPGGAYHYHGMPDLYLTYLAKGQKLTLIGFAVDGFPIYAKWGYTDVNDTTSAVIEMTSSYKLKAVIPTGRPDTSTVKYGTFTQDWEHQVGLGHLDECNGRTSKTPEFPAGVYAYYITNTYPYIQRCIKGTAP